MWSKLPTIFARESRSGAESVQESVIFLHYCYRDQSYKFFLFLVKDELGRVGKIHDYSLGYCY